MVRPLWFSWRPCRSPSGNPWPGTAASVFRIGLPKLKSCDTRDVVLQRTGESVRTTEGCKIVQGTWISPYDGKATRDPQDLDIDHMVPLANAWRSGAATWTDAKREQFANDLTRPELIAVTASTNRSKGDQDPSEWKPPNRDYWCEYAKQWIAVKSYWGLSVTISEKSALTDMLGAC